MGMARGGGAVYRGRLAPSPTGRLHLGVARTALVAWLRARAAGGVLVLRIEDIDGPRVVAGAADAIMHDLRWLGLDWDEGPDVGGPHAPYLQSERSALYASAIARLQAKGLVYPCTCSRKEILEVASAPHGDLGPLYPGTCRDRPLRSDRAPSLRLRAAGAALTFDDGLHGTITGEGLDDFVLQRGDGRYAYQLAVVVDDLAMQISEVVRGDDLLSSTPRQLALYAALDAQPPAFVHVPLVFGPDGRRLSKRHGAPSIAESRAAGTTSEQIIGLLAHTLGLAPAGAALSAAALLPTFSLDALPRTKTELAL
jgi:glutamyl-tRNA synthetase